jgi:hypothetical protein
VRAAAELHMSVIDWGTDDSDDSDDGDDSRGGGGHGGGAGGWDLVVYARGTTARLVPSEVLPGNRLARVDFRKWYSGRPVPVVDLAVLAGSGALGPSAMALVRRMRERAAAESIL